MNMKRISFTAALRNLKHNFCFWISGAAALCLGVRTSFGSLLAVGLLLGAVTAVSVTRECVEPYRSGSRAVTYGMGMLSLAGTFLCYDSFLSAWTDSGYLYTAANLLHCAPQDVLQAAGRLGFLAGAYAIYVLTSNLIHWAWDAACGFFTFRGDRLPERKLLFLLSAAAFFLLELPELNGKLYEVFFLLGVSAFFAWQMPGILDQIKRCGLRLRLVSLLTAMGICWNGQARWCQLCALVPEGMRQRAGILLAAAGLYFAYLLLLLFWNKIIGIFESGGVFRDVTKEEKIVYGILLILVLCLMTAVFSQTNAFYGAPCNYDIIYTSDSPRLVRENAYLTLAHPENDLRQPLFAVFAAPFAGIPYLIGRLISAPASVQAILTNCAQIVLLFTANFLLAKMMGLDPRKRICFMILALCSYTYLLFVLMMEQYVVAYFWLILCLYQISEQNRPDRMTLWGAGGTLLTSMVLILSMSETSPRKNVKGWFADMVKYGLEFVGVILVFCRFDVITGLLGQASSLGGFAGKKLTMLDKIFQYTQFARNCFLAPEAGAQVNSFGFLSWQMAPVTKVSAAGVALVLLVIVSVVLNRRKKSALLFGGWAGFSVAVLLVLGWGTAENGLLLYALYFGWAFLALLFQLVQWLEDRLHVKFLVPLFSAVCALAMLAVNIPAMREMISFAITNYPV